VVGVPILVDQNLPVVVDPTIVEEDLPVVVLVVEIDHHQEDDPIRKIPEKQM